jgi:hypothetical protein
MGNRRRDKRKRRTVKPALDAQQDRSRDALRARRALSIVVVCYLFLASLYVSEVPAGKGPDETAHVRYIEYLAQHHSLPVFQETNPGPDYEFHQPPLYYLICLPSYLLAGRDPAVSAQVIRFSTLLIGLPLLYLTFGLGRLMAPDRPRTGLAAVVAVAFLPMHVYLSASASNDALTEVWFAAALLVMGHHLRAAARYRAGEAEDLPGPWAMVSIGLFIGLGLLTKSLAVLLLPVAWLTAALAARGRERYEWGWLARDLLVATAVAMAVAGWWLVRNQHLYGDPLAQRAFLSAFTDRPSPQQFMARFHVGLTGYVTIVILWTLASTLGVFGPVSGNRFVFFPRWVYVIACALALLALGGLLRYLGRGRLSSWQRQAWWLLAFVGVLLLASFIRFNMSFFQAQARYLFPGVLPAAALAFSLGLEELAPARLKRVLPLAAASLLGLLAFLGLPLWILPKFRLP